MEILSDLVTVSGERTTEYHCESEKVWRAATRKSGNLLYMVWIGIFHRKGLIRLSVSRWSLPKVWDLFSMEKKAGFLYCLILWWYK